MMMKVQIPVEAGNEAIRTKQLPGIIEASMAQLKPEASYFFAEGGVRTALFFFDLADPSQIPVVAEPFFMGANAAVSMVPVMNPEELQAGLGQLSR